MKRKKIIFIITALLLAVSLLPLQPLVSFAARTEEGKMLTSKRDEAGLESENPFLYEDDSKEEGAEEIQIPDTEKAETELVAEISEEGPKELMLASEKTDDIEILEFGKEITCELKEEDANDVGAVYKHYQFTVTTSGRLYIHSVSFSSEKAPEISVYTASPYDYRLHDMCIDIKAGTHYMDISAFVDEKSVGKYSFVVDFESAHEKEACDIKAKKITLGKIYYGQIAEHEDYDYFNYYYFDMPEAGSVQVEMESWLPENNHGISQKLEEVAYGIVDWNPLELIGDYEIIGNHALTHCDRAILQKGRNYIRVHMRNEGNYTIKISLLDAVPVKLSLNKSTLVVPDAETLKKAQKEHEYVNPYHLEATLTYSDGVEITDNRGVLWSSSNEEVLQVNRNRIVNPYNVYDDFIEPIKYGTAEITAVSIENPALAAKCNIQVRFNDVCNSKAFYYQPVYWAVKKGVVADSYYRNKFKPDASCTRLQAVTMLWKLAGCPKADAKLADKFSDMKNRKGKSAVAWGIKSGLIKGFEDGTFRPDEPVNRKQAMILLYRLAGKPKVSGTMKFKDVKYKKTSDAYNAILWGTQKKITKGKTSTAFDPNSACARGQIVTFIYRYVKSK